MCPALPSASVILASVSLARRSFCEECGHQSCAGCDRAVHRAGGPGWHRVASRERPLGGRSLGSCARTWPSAPSATAASGAATARRRAAWQHGFFFGEAESHTCSGPGPKAVDKTRVTRVTSVTRQAALHGTVVALLAAVAGEGPRPRSLAAAQPRPESRCPAWCSSDALASCADLPEILRAFAG
jgi:hypothetical protein